MTLESTAAAKLRLAVWCCGHRSEPDPAEQGIRPVPGKWHPRMPERLDDEELADDRRWNRGRGRIRRHIFRTDYVADSFMRLHKVINFRLGISNSLAHEVTCQASRRMRSITPTATP
jgi:hypothetical protein